MSKQILNIEANLERIKEFFEFSANKLDFNSTKVKVKNEWESEEILEFKDAMNKLVGFYKNRKFPLVADNSIFILNSIPGRLHEVKEKLDQSFEELIKMIDVQTQAIEELQEEIQVKEGEVKELNDKIQMLREEMQNNKFGQMQNQINNLTQHLLGGKPAQLPITKQPESYFTDEIDEGIGEDDDIPAVKIKPLKSQVSKVQLAHDEILNEMKREGLYPLHKVSDIQGAKEMYLGMWALVIPRYGLSEDDYPSFIDNLGSYKHEEDDFLDNVEGK